MNSSVLTNKDIPTALIKVKTIHIKSWALKNWCFWTVVLEKTFESPLDCKEIQPVHPKGDSPGCSLEGLMLKLKLQYFGHLMRRAVSLERPWCWERLGAGGEGDDRGWDGWMAHQHQHNGHGFGWTPGVGDGQGGLACCSSWGCKESDMTELLNWTEYYTAIIETEKEWFK